MSKVAYEAVLHAPIVRRRTVIEASQGQISAFCIQLEFNHGPGFNEEDDWKYIARFDHKPANKTGHDIRNEGLHMDLRDPNGDDREYRNFPPVPLLEAPDYAEEHFDEKYIEICERYLEWHEDVKESWTAILPLPR